MIKTNKFSNLKRLNLKGIYIVLLYLIKIILKIKPSIKELEFYIFYNELIRLNGYIIFDTNDLYIIDFRNKFNKTIKLRKRPSSDMKVFEQIYKFEEYYPVLKKYNENFINDEDYHINIIDAGANIGLASLFFLEHFYKPNIICVEPEQKNFNILDFNLNSKLHNVIKVNGAIWNCNSKIKIVKDFRDKLDWSFRAEETIVDGIQAFSINQLVKDNNFKIIDILKIDIEGSEKQIFNPAISNLNFLNITKCIALEIHDEFHCREDIYKILLDYGFSIINIGESTIGINNNLISFSSTNGLKG